MNKDNDQREIKFQSVHKHYKTGEVVFLPWGPMEGGGFSAPSHLSEYTLIGHRQFTGLLDKNKVEIYEGDKITWSGASDFCVVIWSDKFAGFGLRMNGWLHTHFFNEAVDPNECEVIGHIYSSEPYSEMNDQRVKTDNESAIAEFMGWERYSQNSFKCPNTYPIHNNTSNGWTTFSADQLEFGSRWDWLMPVVEKIENLGYYVNLQTMRSDKDGKYFCNITESNHSAIGHCFSNIKIESVYKAVIQFIHWYQKQKSS